MSTADQPADHSVAGYLRRADRLVRDLLFEAGSLRHDRLLAAWPRFLASAAHVLQGLPPRGTEAAAALHGEVEQWLWAPVEPVRADPRLVAPADLLDRAGRRLERHCPWGASNRLVMADRVLVTVCVGAHVVTGSLRDHLAAPIAPAVSPHTPSRDDADAYSHVVTQVARVEGFALTAIQNAGRYTGPAEPPTNRDRPCSGDHRDDHS